MSDTLGGIKHENTVNVFLKSSPIPSEGKLNVTVRPREGKCK